MTSDDIRRIRWALKKGPRMGRKDRARYLQELLEELAEPENVEGTDANPADRSNE